MLAKNKLLIWVLTGLFAVTTAFFNLYIVLTSESKSRQKKKKQRGASDTIIVALSAANLAHQLVCYSWMSMDEADRECRVAALPYTVLLLLIFSLKFAIMWDTGFLTFYYSAKLRGAPADACCWGRARGALLAHVAPVVLLIPLAGLATCMPIMVVFHYDNVTMADSDCGVLVPDTQAGKIYEVIYLLLADVLPGVLMAKCCISLSVHLAVHLRNMKASTNGAHRPKLGAQMRVIQMALSIVAVFAVFLVVDLYVNYQIAVNHDNAITLTFLFTSVYTTVTATVLIYGKKTLWKHLLRDYNHCVGRFPCLGCLKVPEQKVVPGGATAKVKQ